MLGDLIFESRRFVAPDMIQALLATEHGLLALCMGALVLFDEETGETRASLPLDMHLYRGEIRRAGDRIVVGASEGRIATCRLDGATLVDLQMHDLGVGEEESYTSALAASDEAIHVGLSARRLVVDWSGNIVESIAGPLEGPENRVTVDAKGRAAWGDDARVVVEGLELARSTPYEAPMAFDGNRFVVASLQYSRVTVSVFDLNTTDPTLSATEPTHELQHFGVGDVSAMTFVGDLLLLQSSRCIVAFDLEHGVVAWADALNGPSGAMAVSGETLFVARGHRIHRRALETGARLDAHEGPSHPIVEIVGDGRDVLARDGHRVYAIRDGAVVGEHDAWSVHSVDGRLWLLRRDGVLARFEDGRVVAMSTLRIGTSGATMVELRDREAIVPDPNECEAPKLVRVTGEELVRIADERAMRAWFFGDAFVVHHRTYDESHGRTQGFALVDRDGAERWSEVVAAKDLGVLGVDDEGRAFVVRRDGEAELRDASGSVIGSFGEFPSYVGAPAVLFSASFALLLKPDGELVRIPIAGGVAESVDHFEQQPSAMWADADGRGLIAFGSREIRQVDLREVLELSEQATQRFELETILGASDDDLAATLRGASFRLFDPDRHLAPLQQRLESVPVGDAHRALCEQLMSRGARVLHRHAHESQVIAFALSPDGEHFATGSWVGEDYERGGTLQVWSTRTAKVVKVIDPVDGGVGWPGYGPCLQWSPDGTEIGAAINTNGVGNFPAFGEGAAARTLAYTTNGWNRPPSFAWSNDGSRLAIASWETRSFIPVCLAATDAGSVNGQTARWLAPSPPAGFDRFSDAPRTLRFSADDTTLFCANNHGEAWTIDVASGTLRGFIRYEGPIDASPCGRFVAHAGAHATVVAANGEEIQQGLVESKPELVRWSSRSRLALYANGELSVFEPKADQLVRVASLDTTFGTSSSRYDFTDAPLAAWSPDGSQLAFFTDTGRIAVWTPGGECRSIEVGADMVGVLWQGNVLVALGKNACEVFCGAASQRRRSRSVETRSRRRRRESRAAAGAKDPVDEVFDVSAGFVRLHRIDLSCKHEMLADTPSPLELDGEDLAASLRPSPSFPLGDEWGLAFPDGLVVASEAHRDALKEELAFVVDGRHELPVSWAIRVHECVEEAADALPFAPEIRSKLGTRTSAIGDDVLPLGATATLEDVSEQHWEVVRGLSAGWQSHASEALFLFATLHAACGDAELAAREARRIEEPSERLLALAEVAYRVASLHRELATELTKEAEGLLGQSDQRARDLAGLAAAKHALGLPEAAAMLAEAHDEAWLKAEANPCQNYVQLARAYLRTGREEEAWALLEAAPSSHGMMPSFLEQYIAHVAREGFLDHALRVANRCRQRFESRGTSFTIIEAITDALMRAGRHDDALAYLRKQDGYSTTMYEERVRAERGEVHSELLEQATSSGWPTQIARSMRDLTRAGAGEATVSELLEHLLETMRDSKMSRQSIPEMVESLAEALARVGMASSADTLLQSFSHDDARLALCRGVLRGSSDPYADARLAEAKELAQRAEPKDRGVRLMSLAAAVQKDVEKRILVDEALEGVSELRGDDRRFALSEMMRIALRENELAAAYRVWRKQSKANRGHEVRPLIEALAREGEIAAALHVLRQLARRDDMNGLAQDLRVVAEVYVHGSVVW